MNPADFFLDATFSPGTRKTQWRAEVRVRATGRRFFTTPGCPTRTAALALARGMIADLSTRHFAETTTP